GEAVPGDAKLARLLMNEHLRRDRWPEAAREAAKVIESSSGDLAARGILARHELNAGRPDEARIHLAAIRSPHDEPDSASPGALLLVIGAKRELGEDDSDLLSFIAGRLAPILQTRQVDFLSTEAKLQVLSCYHEACRALDRHPELAGYWVPGARLLRQINVDPERQ